MTLSRHRSRKWGGRQRAAWLVVACCAAAALLQPAAASAITPKITEYSSGLPANGNLEEITTGPDGNMWFTDQQNPGHVDRITPAGVITQFGTANGLTANTDPFGIVAGPDGNMWFTESTNPGRIGRLNPATGAIAEYGTADGLSANAGPDDITAGPDGNLWFTEYSPPGRIGRINPATHAITEYGTANGLTANSAPYGITAGPDGNLWFTESNNPGRIGRINPSTGAITEYGTANGLTPNLQPLAITSGPDGNLWFTEYNNPGNVGRINPSTGAITEYGTANGLTPNQHPSYIITGPDGKLWFTEYGTPGPGAIGRLDPSTGAITQFGSANGLTAGSGPYGLTVGPDGNVWFVEFNTPPRVGRITTPPISMTGGASALASGAATLSGTVNGHAQPTTYRFEFGRTSAYGSRTPAVAAGSGSANLAASARLNGLRPNTTYHYRLDSTNPTDTSYGADATFTTPQLPTVTKLRLKPKRWRAGSKRAKITRKRPPVGTTIRFSLNRSATVRLRFFALKPGRRAGHRCVAPSRGKPGGRRCLRKVLVGVLKFVGHAGRNVVRFQGRLSKKKKLRPGHYKLKVIATDPTAPGQSSSRTASFTVVRS